MLTGIDINEVTDYISPKDTGEPKTVFKLGVIPNVVMASIKDQVRIELLDLVNEDGKTPVKTNLGELQLEYLRFGLKGWENYKGKNGNLIEFVKGNRNVAGMTVPIASNESINCLADSMVLELANKIQSLNTLTEQEIKNSA